MSNNLRTFDFDAGGVIFKLRLDPAKQAPWFATVDALRAAGMVSSGGGGTSRWLQYLDDDEKGAGIFATPGGPQRLSTISKSGLYKLLLRSNKPQAKKLQNYVTRVILPSLDEHGAYFVGQENVGKPGGETQLEFMARAFIAAQEIMTAQAASLLAKDGTILQLTNDNQELAPRAAAFDEIVDTGQRQRTKVWLEVIESNLSPSAGRTTVQSTLDQCQRTKVWLEVKESRFGLRWVTLDRWRSCSPIVGAPFRCR